MNPMSFIQSTLGLLTQISQAQQYGRTASASRNQAAQSARTPPFVEHSSDRSASSFEDGIAKSAAVQEMSRADQEKLRHIVDANNALADKARSLGVAPQVASTDVVAAEFVNATPEHRAMMNVSADMIGGGVPKPGKYDPNNPNENDLLQAAFPKTHNDISKNWNLLTPGDQANVLNQALVKLNLGVPSASQLASLQRH
jgi:hypothetical protein